MSSAPPRLAARAVIVHRARLLLVNAYGGGASDLWCAPGGGVERGQSLPDNLTRELHEETGLHISVGPPCLINEFHDPDRGFHQVELFFRCSVMDDMVAEDWRDPEGVVTKRRWFAAHELEAIRLKPSSLPQVAFDPEAAPLYDPLERIVG